MKRLSKKTLHDMPAHVVRPRYDIGSVKTGIVHLGVGAFHRAHQAMYVEKCLNAGARDWAICGASLRSKDMAEALLPQDCLYTLAERGSGQENLSVIGALRDVIVAPQNPEKLLQALCSPHVRLVTLTITEKGYCFDPATGNLKEDHADIQADLKNPAAPASALGFIVEALRRRRAEGVKPFTVLSCDNLPANGKVVKRLLVRLGHLRDAELGKFIESELACPSSMVDRIVPATSDEDKKDMAAKLGFEDASPVITEAFTQWVIEDDFGNGRPPLEDVGVQMVLDVAPFELMKLRLLNGAHSTLAYLGYLAGYDTVAQTVADPAFVHLIRGMMDEEVMPTLPQLPGIDLEAYKASLLTRFSNPALKHRTWQIAMDGSQKLPQRLLNTARARLAQNAPFDRIALGLAAWMRYVAGTDEKGQPIDVSDPLKARLRSLADQAGPHPEKLATSLLSVREIFGDDLPRDPRFVQAITAALRTLYAQGAAQAVKTFSLQKSA